MLKVNEYQFYDLAIAIHPLTQASHEMKYSEVWLSWRNAADKLNSIFRQRALEFCLQAATDLYVAIGNIVPHDFALALAKFQALSDPEPELGWTVHQIVTAAQKFETILETELSNSDTYWISPKGTRKTSLLMTAARNELPSSVIQDIPEEALIELDEAGRCLLFDVPTAAGFHLFRATEAVIRKYYELVVGTIPATKARNWGAYISALDRRGAEQRITSYLHHIKDNYRNPVLHPDLVLSSDDAQVLFGVCASAIIMMANEMKKSTPLLPLSTATPLPIT